MKGEREIVYPFSLFDNRQIYCQQLLIQAGFCPAGSTAYHSSTRTRIVTRMNQQALRKILLANILLIGLFPALAAELRTPVLTGKTAEGTRIEIYSDLNPLVINRMHSWQVRILDAQGAHLPAQLNLSGGMPGHDHGMPTAPQITGQLENGDYLLEGMRFHMPGAWQLLIELNVDGASQTAVIDFNLR